MRRRTKKPTGKVKMTAFDRFSNQNDRFLNLDKKRSFLQGVRVKAVILKTAEKEKKQTDTPPASPENSANPLISRGLHCIKIDVSIWRAAEDSNPRPSDP